MFVPEPISHTRTDALIQINNYDRALQFLLHPVKGQAKEVLGFMCLAWYLLMTPQQMREFVVTLVIVSSLIGSSQPMAAVIADHWGHRS